MPLHKEPSLLPDAQNPDSVTSRLLLWLTTAGRFIVVFTELVVVLAFLSRFYFDRKNSDISETVRQQKAILDSTKEFESEYSLLQQRLKFIKDFNSSADNQLTADLHSLSLSTPPSVMFATLTVPQPESKAIQANLSFTASNEADIVNYISNLLLNPDIASVDVQSINRKENETDYLVNLTVLFKAKK